MPVALRSLFATVLIFCQPSNPNALWLKYYDALSEDLNREFQDSEAKVRQLTASLDHLLEATDDEIARTRDIIDALDAPIPEHCIHCRGSKTFLYNALYAEIRLMGLIVLPTATSGIAAANIPSGRTTHSRFKILIDTEASVACDVPKQGSLAALIKETTLIIWDEASMARKENVVSLDLLLRDLCDETKLFGGKLVIFGGDFRQVLPVLPRKIERKAVGVSIVSSALWPQLKKFRLTENRRGREDPHFSAFLLALGNGELQTPENNYVQLPSEVVKPLEDGRDPITDLTSLTFPELDLHTFTSDIFTTRAILTPMNDDVDSINT
ncbi:uncharacterized protein [Spinacia oleracea]|uniref:ATP-dependent DNA helicase n=1 Tax=Spinacia oleracea TaxID=3562 RepID=A0A9R0KAW7_SPIOL|nr:uncharacterized protein LOC110803875 [Spinacia oleracea]